MRDSEMFPFQSEGRRLALHRASPAPPTSSTAFRSADARSARPFRLLGRAGSRRATSVGSGGPSPSKFSRCLGEQKAHVGLRGCEKIPVSLRERIFPHPLHLGGSGQGFGEEGEGGAGLDAHAKDLAVEGFFAGSRDHDVAVSGGSSGEFRRVPLAGSFHEDLGFPSDPGALVIGRARFLRIQEAVVSPFFHRGGDVVWQAFGAGVGPWGILEGEEVQEADLLHEGDRLLEVLFRFAREPDDEIAGELDVGNAFPGLEDDPEVARAVVAAAHGAKDAVGSGLGREMEMGADLVEPGHGLEGGEIQIARMGGEESQAPEAGETVDGLEEVGEGTGFFEVFPVGGDALGDECDLLDAVLDEARGLVHDVVDVAASLGSPRFGHHAVGASSGASARDGDEGLVFSGAPRGVPGRKGGFPAEGDEGRRRALGQAREKVGGVSDLAGSEDEVDTGLTSSGLGSEPLGRTAGQADEGASVPLPDLRDACEDLFLGLLPDRTGKEQDDVGLFLGSGGSPSASLEIGIQELLVELVHLAAEGDEEIAWFVHGRGPGEDLTGPGVALESHFSRGDILRRGGGVMCPTARQPCFKRTPTRPGACTRKEAPMAKKESGDVKAKAVCPNENCRFEHNKEDALFCILCGIMLDLDCSRCGENPPYARFCMYCGKDIGKDAAEDVNL